MRAAFNADAGVVDHDIDAAVFLHCRRNQRLDFGRAGRIAFYEDCFCAQLGSGLHRGLRILGVEPRRPASCRVGRNASLGPQVSHAGMSGTSAETSRHGGKSSGADSNRI